MKMKRLLMLFFVLLLVSCSSTRFNVIDEIIGNSIDERIFPGAVLLVGNSQDILYHKAYGTYTYAEDSKKTEKNSLFDLASLTKVFATSMCMMKCIDSGLVDPDAYVINYLPEFNNHGKQVIRIRDLLTHHSGMPAYASRTGSREKTLENIMNMPMTQELGE